MARLIRAFAFLLPLVAAWLAIRSVGGYFYRPSGIFGLVLWIIQATAVGTFISMLVERQSRRLLPLAALFGMSLVFPDETPSRFRVALRSGSLNRLQDRLTLREDDDRTMSPQEAAEQAIAMVSRLSEHDRRTRGHSERVRAYSDVIAERMGVDADDRELLAWAALLHDIGKLHVSPAILNKNGRPSEEEWSELAQHPEHSERLLEPLRDWLGDWIGAASKHHERWDGNGYPHGLSGRDISLAGRIVAVADAYDTMTSTRSYKKALPPETARKELVACAGSQFDPAVVRAFLNVSLGRRWTAVPLAWLTERPSLASGASVIPTAALSTLAVLGAAATGVVPASPANAEIHLARMDEEVAASTTTDPESPIERTTTTQRSEPDAERTSGSPRRPATTASSGLTGPSSTSVVSTTTAPNEQGTSTTELSSSTTAAEIVGSSTSTTTSANTGGSAIVTTTTAGPTVSATTSPPPTTTTATTISTTTTTTAPTTTISTTTTTTAPTTTTSTTTAPTTTTSTTTTTTPPTNDHDHARITNRSG